MTEHAHIRYTKWDGSLHWHFDADVIGRDGHGTWVVVPPGGTYRRGDEPPRVDEFGFVVLVPDGGWWTAYFNAVPRGSNGHLVYVDVNTAPVWNGGTVTMIDLDLDVTLAPSGTARVIDQDEFDEHRVRWSYPPDVVDRVRTTAARIASAIDLGREPFDTIGPDHVTATLGWVHGTIEDVDASLLRAGIRRPLAPGASGPIDCRVAIDGEIHAATIVDHGPGVLHLLTPTITAVQPEAPISVGVDPSEATFDVA